MATTWKIDGVRTYQAPEATHPHITHVRVPGVGILSRSTVIADLRSLNGDRYYTLAGGVRAEVIVAGCPHCGYGDYITTAPDWTTANNLLSLPRV